MKISPIAFNSVFLNNRISPKPIYFGMTCDVFERTTPNNSAIEWFKKQSPDDIKRILNNPDNKIGHGFSHIAYNIPGNEDFVLRTSIDFDVNKISEIKPVIKDIEDKQLKINAGQPMAIITYKNPKTRKSQVIEILRKQKGIPVGVFPQEVYEVQKNKLRYTSKVHKDRYSKSLEALAKFPVSSFEKLIEDIQEASKCNYTFDYLNSNNLLYDEETQSIGIIDLEKGRSEINYGAVLYALTNASYLKMYHGVGYKVSQKDKDKAFENNQQIMEKFIKAMENKGLNDLTDDCMMTYASVFFGILMSK